MDPYMNVLREASEASWKERDRELATPQQDPSSPFLSPPSTSNSLCIVNSNQQPMTSDDRIRKLALKSQDADHRRRFERFLNLCGIKRYRTLRARGIDEYGRLVDRYLNTKPADDDAQIEENSDRSAELGNRGESDLVADVQETPVDGHEDFDQFYDAVHQFHPPGESFLDISVIGNDDSEFSYTRTDGPITVEPVRIARPPLLPKNAQDSFLGWDTKRTRMETASKLQNKQFEDALAIEYIGLSDLKLIQGKKFKNNLTCFSNTHQIMFVGISSTISCHSIDADNKPKSPAILHFDTKPTVRNSGDAHRATWPYFPFTINYLKVDIFNGNDVLAATCDDGRVLIWYVEALLGEVDRYNKMMAERSWSNSLYTIKVPPAYELKMSFSAWSVDFYDAYSLIVVSDNSQTITLFYYDDEEQRFHPCTSHALLHNIPTVSFIKTDSSSDQFQLDMKIKISSISISCELVIFEFKYRKRYGPWLPSSTKNRTIRCDIEEEEAQEEVDGDTYRKVDFYDCARVINRTLLHEDGWTVNFIEGKYFKKVDSFMEATGDISLRDDSALCNTMIRQNEILDAESDPCVTSDFGFAAKIQHFNIPVKTVAAGGYSGLPHPMDTLSDRYRRIRKMFDAYYLEKKRSKAKSYRSLNGKYYWEPVVTSTMNDQFLCMTSSSKLGLFNTESLLCVGSTEKPVFNLNFYENEDDVYSNRLSLSCLIPELSCLVIASQLGYISIFRLCVHRGCYTMRQEFSYPSSTAEGGRLYSTICGICVRKMGPADDEVNFNPRYVLYVTQLSGVVFCYYISEGLRGLEVTPV